MTAQKTAAKETMARSDNLKFNYGNQTTNIFLSVFHFTSKLPFYINFVSLFTLKIKL